MSKHVIYATDLDRTLIFSYRFLNEIPYNKEKVLVETKEGKELSYMSKLAYDKLQDISVNNDIIIVPVTTRSIDEYKRVNLGFIPKYAIVANGGVILENGEPCIKYSKYIKSYLDPLELATLSIDLMELTSLSKEPKLIDSCYWFMKTNNEDLFDVEIHDLIEKYPKWQFIRQKNKCYIIPIHISKQIALRWLYNELSKPYIIASGDSLLDIPMLSLANEAIVPYHSDLLKDKVVQNCRVVHGGIESPYKTMLCVEKYVN